MKNFFLTSFILFIFLLNNSRGQNLFHEANGKLNESGKINSVQSFSHTAAILFPFNPILSIENKKFYVGITKEFSLIFYPYGRVAVEYSLIFRETHLNQLRASYNFDIPLEVGDGAAVLASFGGGYFTDFNKEGYFPQASIGLLLAVDDNIGANIYIKPRYTIMTDSDESNIFDLSFGIATYIGF